MSASGKAMMGTGEAEGENRAMAATELALNNPLIDEYTLQGAKGLLVNITGGSDIKLFEVDAAVNKIRAEVDPEAELIFGAIKDDNMNGKIRVSIVATSLNGSSGHSELRPVFNIVNGSNNRNTNMSENLFSKGSTEQNIFNSIDGATALKLDESYEIKNIQEQNSAIESFENHEESEILANVSAQNDLSNAIPNGVSIESASYMEKNTETINKEENELQKNNFDSPPVNNNNENEEYTPKLFAEDQANEVSSSNTSAEEDYNHDKEHLFDQESNEEEDFEIPAFLRRQKF